jgi:hypothetical protein
MDRYDDASVDENLLNATVPDDALERAAGSIVSPAWTMNFCTYDYYQCGPIGQRP